MLDAFEQFIQQLEGYYIDIAYTRNFVAGF